MANGGSTVFALAALIVQRWQSYVRLRTARLSGIYTKKTV